MMKEQNATKVTAAIIREDDKILICQRAEGVSCSGLWEFPGGKLENDETLKECLVRECQEELGVTLKVKDVFAQTFYKYGEKDMEFTFFCAEITEGGIMRKVHEDIRWVKPEELRFYSFCPADVEVAQRLARGMDNNRFEG